MIKTLLLLAVIVFASATNSQSIPVEMHFSADGKILYTGGQTPTGLYDPSSVKTINLNFAQTDYWAQLTANYASETDIPATMIYDGVTYPEVGVRFRGNTSYTMTGTSQKKSFAVTMDYLDPEQNVLGYNSLKFNNGHQDGTFMREVVYNRMAARHTPIAKGNFVHLFINGEDWGLYPNIQSVDKNFLSEWFLSNDGARFRANPDENSIPGGSWGDGTAGMNYISADTLAYKVYYSLKSSDISYPWQKLVDACQMLSLATNNNKEQVKQVIDLDKALWFLAAENIFTDDDSYVMKGKMDYMVYFEPETGRTTPFEYDGNSTFQNSAATSWAPFKNTFNANYPLLNKLLNIPEWRQRYLAHYRTILNETFTTQNANAIIDGINAQISELVASDPKKLYTTAQYTSGVISLKNFVANRRNFLLSNPDVAQIAPVIASAPYYNNEIQQYVAPGPNQPANILATVSSATGINRVNLYYATGIVGNFDSVEMFDNGAHNDGAASDGVFGAAIPGYDANTHVRYYIEAVANNAALSANYLPTGAEHDVFVYTVTPSQIGNGIVINEFMAGNTAMQTDEDGEFEDWVELYNNNDFEVDLSGYYLSDNLSNITKWQFPSGTAIPAGGYLMVWADDEPGPLHASWKISADGEDLVLADASQNIVDSVTFGAQAPNMGYARVPNGVGDFVTQYPTFGATNNLLSVNEVSNLNLAVYPNPVRGKLHIGASQGLDGEPMVIYNSMGQQVYLGKFSSNMTVDTSGFASGMYFLKCGQITKKLIVSR